MNVPVYQYRGVPPGFIAAVMGEQDLNIDFEVYSFHFLFTYPPTKLVPFCNCNRREYQRMKYILFIGLLICLPRQCICEVTVLQWHYYLQNCRFCNYDPPIGLKLTLFEKNTQISVLKYIIFNVLHTSPPRQSIYEVAAVQMHYWLQACRFCIFAPIWP